jgi:hypothetical protein
MVHLADVEYIDIAAISDGQVFRNDFLGFLFFLGGRWPKKREVSVGAPA